MPYFNNTLVVPKPVLWYSCPLAVSHWLYHTGCITLAVSYQDTEWTTCRARSSGPPTSEPAVLKWQPDMECMGQRRRVPWEIEL
jgi:hypothetical protein